MHFIQSRFWYNREEHHWDPLIFKTVLPKLAKVVKKKLAYLYDRWSEVVVTKMMSCGDDFPQLSWDSKQIDIYLIKNSQEMFLALNDKISQPYLIYFGYFNVFNLYMTAVRGVERDFRQ